MRWSFTLATAAVVLAAVASAYTPASTSQTDALAAKGLLNLAVYHEQEAMSGVQNSCSLQNVAVRREW